MNAGVCPRCGDPVLTVGAYVLDLIPGDKGRTTAQAQITIEPESVELLSGERLSAARRGRIPLFRRHGISCCGFWPR